jgi:hypothetical protein
MDLTPLAAFLCLLRAFQEVVERLLVDTDPVASADGGKLVIPDPRVNGSPLDLEKVRNL